MKKLDVYIDLDRTLFQTNNAEEIWQQLELIYPKEVNAAKEHGRRSDFYTYSDELYCHDVGAQLQEIGLEPRRVYKELAASPLSDGRFEFPGCKSLIEFLRSESNLAILTYGVDDYQRFKAALCPSLAGITIQTTMNTKPEWLLERVASGWLIDDKSIGQSLPPDVRFVQVSLEGRGLPAEMPLWPLLCSLGEVEAYMRQNLSKLK